ncbi:MAG TPA: phosphatase PAP2 family protein [Candidatus Dormibacteraeota bacterium]|nr:phosphatase PAP2 family protein [Candidatus Dormibacteraeota bacterium]
MRASEWIQIAFAFGIGLLAWARPLEMRRRLRIALLAVIVPAAILMARYALHGLAGSVVCDWLPAALLLIPYWQAGQFFTGPGERIQKWLAQTDEKALRVLRRIIGSSESGGWARYFETAYLMCYPLVPIGMAALYLGHHRAAADFYWIVVVLASDICFAVTIFVPAMPPRLIPERASESRVAAGSVRKLNLEVLNRGSIQAITFPSAHVASTTAVALVLTRFMPLTGAIFLVIAASIAIGAFLGRYHYFLDVALGALEAAAVFLFCLLVFRR